MQKNTVLCPGQYGILFFQQTEQCVDNYCCSWRNNRPHFLLYCDNLPFRSFLKIIHLCQNHVNRYSYSYCAPFLMLLGLKWKFIFTSANWHHNGSMNVLSLTTQCMHSIFSDISGHLPFQMWFKDGYCKFEWNLSPPQPCSIQSVYAHSRPVFTVYQFHEVSRVSCHITSRIHD